MLPSSLTGAPQVWTCATELQPLFGAIDARVAVNLARVQAAFKQNRIGPHHFQGSTGYGHGDLGREALDNVSGVCEERAAGQGGSGHCECDCVCGGGSSWEWCV